ncbi:MAG: hypothetical protein ACRDTM_04670 [Micromonosporaceae bacterium]
MRGKVMFVAGLAIGYVLGSKAGRERYEQIVRAARKVRSNPTVQEATGLVQAQGSRLISTGRDKVRGTLNDRLGETRLGHSRIGQRLLGDRDQLVLDDPERPPDHQGF